MSEAVTSSSEPAASCEEASDESPMQLGDPQKEQVVGTLLTKIKDWDFDLFQLDKETGGHSLQFILWRALSMFGIISTFRIDCRALREFLRELEAAYRANPYHTSMHAADVVQSVVYFISKPEILPHLRDIEIFSLLIGSAAHDVGHDGHTNLFHVNSGSSLAIQHNDSSVQERHHCSLLFKITSRNEANIFSGMEESDRKKCRSMILELILHTDMQFRDQKTFEKEIFFKKRFSDLDHVHQFERTLSKHGTDITRWRNWNSAEGELSLP